MKNTKKGIYTILIADRVVYVGQSISISNRWRTHRFELEHGTHPNRALQGAFDKHASSGVDAAGLDFNLVEPVENIFDLNVREKAWIDRFGLENLCNVAPGSSRPHLYGLTGDEADRLLHATKLFSAGVLGIGQMREHLGLQNVSDVAHLLKRHTDLCGREIREMDTRNQRFGVLRGLVESGVGINDIVSVYDQMPEQEFVDCLRVFKEQHQIYMNTQSPSAHAAFVAMMREARAKGDAVIRSGPRSEAETRIKGEWMSVRNHQKVVFKLQRIARLRIALGYWHRGEYDRLRKEDLIALRKGRSLLPFDALPPKSWVLDRERELDACGWRAERAARASA